MKTVIFASVLVLPLAAHGQSFNCDLDVFDGTPEIGNGAPSSAFGAAANQPGFWNRLNSGGPPQQLRGLDGNLRSVYFHVAGANATAGYRNLLNTGDYALLLNDVTLMGGQPLVYSFTGLETGWYLAYTYAVRANLPPSYSPTDVFVDGSKTHNPQVVTGPMPGNSFAEGITHSIHEVFVSNGVLRVIVSDSNPVAHINGLQIVAVPEPGALLVLGSALVAMSRRKRRRA